MIEFLIDNLPQAVGFVALCLAIIGFQLNIRSRILFFQASANILWAVHFYLIGAFTGSAMNVLAVSRNYTFVKYRQRFSHPLLPIIFITIFAIATAMTWQGYVSLLPFFGMSAGTIAFWHKNPRTIRLLSLAAPPMWFTYNFISGSYPGMIVETFVTCSILIAIFRYDILKKPENRPTRAERSALR